MRRVAVAVDVLAVVLFVAIGRTSHHHVQTVGGFVSTAWPFTIGLACGWLGVVRRPPMSLRTGLVVCSATVVVGMMLRVLAGQGTAVAFIAVALIFLGAVMIGGRMLLAASLRRWSSPTGSR
ncbi:MAG TPA: DUF3054 domain-containing protein [Acidimicrobiales bacterium]|jgi:hypothetical protein|nr:DUF3054 domain-containing protein [Acidimicrobiales bacterium]